MSSSPSFPSTMYSGIASRIGGTIRTTSAPTSESRRMRSPIVDRVSAYAPSVPTARLMPTESATTTRLFPR